MPSVRFGRSIVYAISLPIILCARHSRFVQQEMVITARGHAAEFWSNSSGQDLQHPHSVVVYRDNLETGSSLAQQDFVTPQKPRWRHAVNNTLGAVVAPLRSAMNWLMSDPLPPPVDCGRCFDMSPCEEYLEDVPPKQGPKHAKNQTHVTRRKNPKYEPDYCCVANTEACDWQDWCLPCEHWGGISLQNAYKLFKEMLPVLLPAAIIMAYLAIEMQNQQAAARAAAELAKLQEEVVMELLEGVAGGIGKLVGWINPVASHVVKSGGVLANVVKGDKLGAVQAANDQFGKAAIGRILGASEILFRKGVGPAEKAAQFASAASLEILGEISDKFKDGEEILLGVLEGAEGFPDAQISGPVMFAKIAGRVVKKSWPRLLSALVS